VYGVGKFQNRYKDKWKYRCWVGQISGPILRLDVFYAEEELWIILEKL